MRGVLGVVLGGRAKEVRVFAGDVVKNKKPAPDIYLLAAKELDLAPPECVVIEDTEIGCRAAKHARMNCVVTFNGRVFYACPSRPAALPLTPGWRAATRSTRTSSTPRQTPCSKPLARLVRSSQAVAAGGRLTLLRACVRACLARRPGELCAG